MSSFETRSTNAANADNIPATESDTELQPKQITAAVLIIGNEILSGRTHDINLPFIADALGQRGIRLVQARVIPDDAQVIQDSVNELRHNADFVFTTGGIGPTHDDITAENVAAAFDVELHDHPQASALLLAYFKERGVEPNTARMRMARVPQGATLVDNPVSVAPGFRMDNVFVMAGVPKIMQAMLANILPELPMAQQLLAKTIICNLPEGTLAAPLGDLQANYPDLDIGSYPGKTAAGGKVSLVVRGQQQEQIDAAVVELREMISILGGKELDA